MERHIFSVTEVNELVKLLLDNEPMLSGICVRGEISNYKMYQRQAGGVYHPPGDRCE